MDAVFEHEVQVRYRDLDTYGHVNNVVYGTYCEEARAAWARDRFDLEDMEEFSIVVASLELDFRRSVRTRGTVTVEARVRAVGRSSFTLSYRIRSDDDLMVEGESTQVYVDPESGDPAPLPEPWRERLERAADADG